MPTTKSSQTPVIELKDVGFSFDSAPVLRDVNLTILQGDFVAIIGPNGGGKTTLVKIILGLLKPQKGKVRLLGSPPEKSSKRAGYMPQYATGEKDFPIRVIDVVLLGLMGVTGCGPFFKKDERRRAEKALDLVGMLSFAQKRVNELSGGQLQRTLLARALVSDPEILFLDEPMANIDIGGQTKLFDLLGKLNEEMTIVFVTHDVGLLSRHVKSVVCVNQTVFFHPSAQITPEMATMMMGETCPMELVAHGLPHRVLGRHQGTQLHDCHGHKETE